MLPIANALTHKAQLCSALCRAGVQPRLEVGAVNDPLELEADRVAEHLMRMPEPLAGEPPLSLQTPQANWPKAKASEGPTAVATPQLESDIHSLSQGGTPLDTASRTFFEPRFGENFSQVRLHTDAPAAQMADALGAKAFTLGNDIAFGEGQYAPHASTGKNLLGHELAHVVQQRGSNAGAPQTKRVQREVKALPREPEKKKILPYDPRNEVLKRDRYNQFLPEVILNSGHPEVIREFIKDSNEQAYSWEIDALYADIYSKMQKFQEHCKEPDENKRLILLNKVTGEVHLIEEEIKELKLRHDVQTKDAIDQFNTYYLKGWMGNSQKRSTAQLVREAGEKYNDWVFYLGTEGEEVTKNPELYMKGTGDRQSIEMNDVKQGALFGDCYFLAAIAAIAGNRRELIQRMIEDNKDGTYTVTLYSDVNDPTKKEKITVDLKVPSVALFHAQLSGDTNKKGAQEVWPIVLEKAYAKYKGSYGAIKNGGLSVDVFYTLTGIPPLSLEGSQLSAALMERYIAQKKPMVLGTGPMARSTLQEYELGSKHAYAIKEVRTLRGKRYLILYNPYGMEHPHPIPMEEVGKLSISVCNVK